ncbi:MAG: electron transfer flavoprotein beta subunit/FixA family protein, partial [Acidimicrobiia bacterium]|nr:electron transfer flavoprotein beta subunit/FixA family protein [Acidimicrobiia bacterium]
RMETPVVLGVLEGINLPRYPTLKGRLSSKKAPVDSHEIDAEPGDMTMVRLVRPPEQLTETVILGHGPEAAPKVVEVLRELGVLT